MQGLALARGLRVVPVSTLDALGRLTLRTRTDGARASSRRGSMRSAAKSSPRCTTAASSAPLAAPVVSARPQATLEAWRRSARARAAVVFVGDGAVRYADLIARTLGATRDVLEPAPRAGRAMPRASPRSTGARGRAARRRPDLRQAAGRGARARPAPAADARRRDTRHGHQAARAPTCAIERLVERRPTSTRSSTLEARSFTNPWTREMLSGELAQSDVAQRLRAAPAGSAARRVLFLLDVCSTSCTSTRWSSTCRTAARGSAIALMRWVIAEAVAARRPPRHARGAASRTSRRAGSTKAWDFRSWRAGTRYYTQPEEDALILWREHLAKSAVLYGFEGVAGLVLPCRLCTHSL